MTAALDIDAMIRATIDDPCRTEMVPAQLAGRLSEQLKRDHLDDYIAWFLDHDEAVLRWFIGSAYRAQRHGVERRARQAFSAAASDYASSGSTFDPDDAVHPFSAFLLVSADNLQRRVGEMTGDDHRFVAASYERSGKRDLTLAAFHRRVADRVGTQRTCDVFSEQEYARLLGSI